MSTSSKFVRLSRGSKGNASRSKTPRHLQLYVSAVHIIGALGRWSRVNIIRVI